MGVSFRTSARRYAYPAAVGHVQLSNGTIPPPPAEQLIYRYPGTGANPASPRRRCPGCFLQRRQAQPARAEDDIAADSSSDLRMLASPWAELRPHEAYHFLVFLSTFLCHADMQAPCAGKAGFASSWRGANGSPRPPGVTACSIRVP